MPDPAKEFSIPRQEPIKAVRGVPFHVFPPDRPIIYWPGDEAVFGSSLRFTRPEIEVEGLGLFEMNFANWYKNEEELASRFRKGERIVLCTFDGPVELKEEAVRGGTHKRVLDGSYLNVVSAIVPRGLDPNMIYINFYLPRFQVSFDTSTYSDRSLYILRDDQGQIDLLLTPSDQEFLHKIKAEIG